LSIKKDYFVCQKDAKKRLLIITAKFDKPFVGKALVQRVEEKHEIVRETDDVIHFMASWLPMIKYKRQQLESQSED
jgi:hypothetical protein